MVSILQLTIKRHHLNALLGRSQILMTIIFHSFLVSPMTNCHEFEQIMLPFAPQFPYLHNEVVKLDVL